MRETRFIQQMKDKWKDYEKILDSPNKAPEKLYDVFINIMNDLSYARTFYPNRSVRVYLNGLAQRIFLDIYKNKPSHKNKLIAFWTDDLPRLVFEARRDFLVAFLIFLASFLIGVLSSAMDPEFAEVILGNDYVEMTRENITSGDPMAVYKQKGELGMSVGIAGNNLFVAFLTFVLGIFFTIGSIVIMVSNGVMVGAFQYFFIEQDLFWESFLTIWIHGTLEISAIIIAGAAGITMGKGIVFPGSYSRAKSFQKSARRGLKIMIGIIPIFLLAAFFEGYLTRHTEASYFLRGLFIFVNLLFVIGYFVVYPRWKASKGFAEKIDTYQLQADKEMDIEWFKIKNVTQLFGDTILLFRKYFRTIIFSCIAAAILYTGLAYFLANDFLADFYFPQVRFGTMTQISQFFINENWWLGIAFILPFALLILLIYNRLYPKEDFKPKSFLFLLSMPIIFYLSIYFLGGHILWIIFFLFPLLFLVSFIAYEKEALFIPQFFNLFSNGNYIKSLGLFTTIILIGILLLTIMDTIAFSILFDMLAWLFPFEQATLDVISIIVLIFFTMTSIFLILSLFTIAISVFYFAALESQEAIQLKSEIQSIGISKNIRGIERE